MSEADIERSTSRRYASPGRAPASVARALVAVRALHRFAAVEGGLATDPTADVALPRVPAGLPKPLSEDDVTDAARSRSSATRAGRPARPGRSSSCSTAPACASPSWCGLSLGDVDLEPGLLRVFGKGAKERIVPIGQAARRAARRLARRPPGAGPLEPDAVGRAAATPRPCS